MIKIQKSRKRKPYQKGYSYGDYILVLDFDTTTTADEKQAYISAWCIKGDDTYCGNDIYDLKHTFDLINKEIGENRIVLFVKNLSHLFQFLKGIHMFQDGEYFAMEEHKILNCRIDNIEFRCLTLHSNMKMREYTAKYGDSTYSLKKSLEDRCIAIRSAIVNEMKAENDDLYSFPATSTEYVRRDIRKAMYKPNNRSMRERASLDIEVFHLLDDALRGGNCIANRFRTGEIIEQVKSADRCSAYTDSILNHEYPIGNFKVIHDCSWKKFKRYVEHHYACVMEIEFIDIELKDINNPAPYLTGDCSEELSIIESGRIIESPRVFTTITDVDLSIIMKQYDMKCATIHKLAYARYGSLPKEILDVQRSYYKLKTELKGVKERHHEYIKNKAKNNSIAGIFQQRPIYKKFTIENNVIVEIEQSEEEALADANKKAYVSYSWGVWTTAWARYELQKAIDLAGSNFLYTDTDSVKYVGDIDWTELNNKKIEESKLTQGYAKDINDEIHYVGVWEQEETATQFCMLGQKKYASLYGKKLEITVSGLDKELGSKALKKGDEYGCGIERFQMVNDIPFVFHGCAGGIVLYNDYGLDTIEVDGQKITSNMVIKSATFTLTNEDDDYESIAKTRKLNFINY